MGCTSCGCSTGAHIDIGYGTYHCSSCKRHCTWFFSPGASWCYICHKKMSWGSSRTINYDDRDRKPGPNLRGMN